MSVRVSAKGIAAAGAVALALGNLGRLPGGMLGGRAAPVVALDLVVGVVWLVLIGALFLGRVRPVIDGVMTATTAFVLVAFLSTALAFSRYGLGFSDGVGVVGFLARWIAYFGWYPFVVWCLTPDESADAWRYLEIALLAFCAFGIFQSAFFPGFAQMVGAGGGDKQWDIQGRRLVSTLLDPNFAGVVIVIALLFRLARVSEGEKESAPAMVALAVGLLLTVSRGAILALLVGLGVIAIARGLRRKLLKVVAIAGVLVLPFLSLLISFAAGFNKLRFDMSAAQRLVPWTRAIKLIAEHPVLGIGFNAIQQAQFAHGWNPVGGADISLDGGLLFVAAMTGIVGVSLYVTIMLRVTRAARRAWNDPELLPRDRAHAAATVASTAAVVVHSLFVNSLLLPFVMQLLWVMWGRLAHIGAARRVRLGLPYAIPLVLAATACDPCAGTVNCTSPPHVAATGTIVDHLTGAPLPNVHVSAVISSASSGGVSVDAVTDASGVWLIRADAPAGDSTRARFTISAPGQIPYTTPEIPLHSLVANGDADVEGQWTDVPYAHYEATLTRRGAPLSGAAVAFSTATPGVHIETGVSATNTSGVFRIDLSGSQVGLVTGTLNVSHGLLARPSNLASYTIPLDYRFSIPHPVATVPVGGQLAYGGETLFRGTGEKVGNVGVDFVRTGGVETTPATFTTKSNDAGFFRIDLTPLGDGDVIGDLTLRPPNAAPAVYRNVHLATYDSIGVRSSGLWAFGEKWAWTVELWRFDSLKPAPNVGVIFRRTGGVAIDPATIDHIQTGSDGRVELRAAVHDTGVVNGELVLFAPGAAPRVVPNIKLRTNPDDQLHYAGIIGFGPALRYVGEVLTVDGAPVVGAQVEWTQTSGIPATPNALTTVTGNDGRFPLTLFPSTDGEVVGRVTVHPPAPWAPGTAFVFENLRLNTFESSDLRLAVTYRIAKP